MPQTTPTFCLACGYPLSYLPENRCPECGRPFNPTDPRTMSLAKPLKPWQRRLLKPTSWPTVTFAILAAILMAWLSGWPTLEPVRPYVLSQEVIGIPRLLRLHQLKARLLHPGDILFFTSFLLLGIFLLLFVPRQLARLLVPRPAFRTVNAGPRRRYRYIAILLALTVFATCLIFSWQKRIGRRWVDSMYGPPVELSPEESGKVIGAVISDFPRPGRRAQILSVLVGEAKQDALPGLLRAADGESDPLVLAQELHVISLFRNPQTASLFTRYLTDTRAEVRAAAADGIGILHHPTYDIPFRDRGYSGQWIAIDGNPTINLANNSNDIVVNRHLNDPPVAIDPSVQTALLHMMTDGPTAQERETAARAIVIWPPDNYKLRVAEWGVWIDLGGHLSLAKSLVSETPPFVHRTGNPDGGFDSLIDFPRVVFKPIIHLTANSPLAVDLEVRISQGRPWFAFPLPDDFSFDLHSGAGRPVVEIGGGAASPADFDDFSNPHIASLPNPRYGYPWISPHHRSRYVNWGPGNIGILDLGLQWQSVIVCPQRPGWMSPPAVPNDPRFAWWSALRNVPSSWVSSRGESDRFIFYDGPTRAPEPIQVVLNSSSKALQFSGLTPQPPLKNVPPNPSGFNPIIPPATLPFPEREGLYVEFRNGHLQGQYVEVEPGKSAPLAPDLPLNGSVVIDELRRLLTSYGLTIPESDGLIAAWTPQFFKSEGRRFILRMSPDDYARQCPISVRPTPTEVARLGLILTEFDADPPAPPATPPAQ